MVLDFHTEIPEPTIIKIMTFIIAKTYYRAGAVWEKGKSPNAQNAFYLHLNMNIIYILMFGERKSIKNNVILMRDALDKIDHNIKVPLKLEKRVSESKEQF